MKKNQILMGALSLAFASALSLGIANNATVEKVNAASATIEPSKPQPSATTPILFDGASIRLDTVNTDVENSASGIRFPIYVDASLKDKDFGALVLPCEVVAGYESYQASTATDAMDIIEWLNDGGVEIDEVGGYYTNDQIESEEVLIVRAFLLLF